MDPRRCGRAGRQAAAVDNRLYGIRRGSDSFSNGVSDEAASVSVLKNLEATSIKSHGDSIPVRTRDNEDRQHANQNRHCNEAEQLNAPSLFSE